MMKEKYFIRKSRGSITLYLSIIMVGVMLFVSVVSEAARIHVVYSESESFAYMAADSVLAGYGRQIYDEYGILLVWENESVKEELEKYIQANINMADLREFGTNFMSTRLSDIEVKDVGYVTDREGEVFVEQVISYMKYAGATEAVSQLVNLFEEYQKGNDAEKETVTYMFDNNTSDNDSTELQELVEEINGKVSEIKDIKKIKELTDAVSQILEKINSTSKGTKKFMKEYSKLRKELDKEARTIGSTIILGESYEGKKAAYLKENGYTSGERDYIEDNLVTLKNIRDGLYEEKALNVSEVTEWNSENIEKAKKSIVIVYEQIVNMQSLKEHHATEKDNENKSIYESAKALLEKGILSLVIEDVSNVSNTSISDLNLPSNIKKQKDEKNLVEKTRDKAVFAMYLDKKFGNYTSPKTSHNLSYELEYVINGKDSDSSNLTATVEKIVGVRNLMNLAYLVTDEVKMKELSMISASAATAVGLPFIEPIVKIVLMEAWSLAEAMNDVKVLLKGKKIALVKSKEDWRTDIKNLLGGSPKKGSNSGKLCLNYEQYCQILIMFMDTHECIYRTMDLIQLNIKKQYNYEFQMNQCFGSISFCAIYETEPLFTAMPWVVNSLNHNNGAYEYKIMCDMKY